jgi:hypothetical protein
MSPLLEYPIPINHATKNQPIIPGKELIYKSFTRPGPPPTDPGDGTRFPARFFGERRVPFPPNGFFAKPAPKGTPV